MSDVTVAVDENINALVITATPYQYAKVEEILKKLDRLPRQVLVEVTIGEVTLTGAFQFGIEWAFKHNGQLQGTLQTLGGLGVGTSGLLYTIQSIGGNFQAVLNAFATEGVLKVLSTPRLVVMDNQEASINVGTDVPIITSQATAGIQQEGNTTFCKASSTGKRA